MGGGWGVFCCVREQTLFPSLVMLRVQWWWRQLSDERVSPDLVQSLGTLQMCSVCPNCGFEGFDSSKVLVYAHRQSFTVAVTLMPSCFYVFINLFVILK